MHRFSRQVTRAFLDLSFFFCNYWAKYVVNLLTHSSFRWELFGEHERKKHMHSISGHYAWKWFFPQYDVFREPQKGKASSCAVSQSLRSVCKVSMSLARIQSMCQAELRFEPIMTYVICRKFCFWTWWSQWSIAFSGASDISYQSCRLSAVILLLPRWWCRNLLGLSSLARFCVWAESKNVAAAFLTSAISRLQALHFYRCQNGTGSSLCWLVVIGEASARANLVKCTCRLHFHEMTKQTSKYFCSRRRISVLCPTIYRSVAM